MKDTVSSLAEAMTQGLDELNTLVTKTSNPEDVARRVIPLTDVLLDTWEELREHLQTVKT